MKRIIYSTIALLAIAGGAFAQSYSDKLDFNYDAFQKVRKIDLLFNLLPVLFTKSQINSLLNPIETARQNVRKVRENEYKVYKDLNLSMDDAIKAGIEKSQLPPTAFRNKLDANIKAMEATRGMFAAQNVDTVRKVFDKVLNKGQIKVAINSMDPRLFNPNAKPEEMTDDQKENMYIREILLDPLTYDILVEMAKHVS